MIPTPEGIPERPDTPDFWVLSDIILKFDGDTSEGGKTFDEVISEVYPDLNLDDNTVAYMATQRAFRALGVRTVRDVQQRGNEIALLAALWMEGFTVGVTAHDRLKALGDGTTELITFRWSRNHGDCVDCGRPAAFKSSRYVKAHEPQVPEDKARLCALCAANDAADGEVVRRIEGEHDDESE